MEKQKAMSDGMRNECRETNESSFLVRIKFQENSTWQGNIRWIEKDEEQNFRSMFEMIKLIDGTFSSQEKVQWD